MKHEFVCGLVIGPLIAVISGGWGGELCLCTGVMVLLGTHFIRVLTALVHKWMCIYIHTSNSSL